MRSSHHRLIEIEIVLRHSLDGKSLFEDVAASLSVNERKSRNRLSHFRDVVADIACDAMIDDLRNRSLPIG